MIAPPPLAERMLAALESNPDWRDAILGDLREEYVSMADRHGLPYARRWYWTQAIGIAANRAAARIRRGPARRRLDELEPSEPPRAGIGALLSHDLRAAWRSLRHRPALAATVIVVLALGLAANATIFALADAIVLRPFRYPGIDRAVLIASDVRGPFFNRTSVAPGDFLDWRDETGGLLDRLAGVEWWDPQLLHDGPPQQLTGFRVSPELFEIMGEPPILGRTLTDGDARQVPPVVLGYEFWMRQFGGRSDALGARLRLDGVVHEVVGVMPTSFAVPFGSDLWAPLELAPAARQERQFGRLMVVGRRSKDVTLAQIEDRLGAILAEQRRTFPETHATRTVSVFTYADGSRDPGAGPFVAVWQAAAFVLLLVGCANVANLLLARNAERQREFSVRLALGASGGRLTSQLLVEGALLATSAALLAVPLVWAALGAVRASFPDAVIRFVPGWAFLRLEPRTLLATAALAGATVMLIALMPAWRAARQNVAAGLRIGARSTDGAERQRGRSALAVCQIALTLALLVAAGLALSAVYRATEGPLGFEPAQLLVGRIGLPDRRYATPEARRLFVERTLARLNALPAVRSAAITSNLPYSTDDWTTRFWREDTAPRPADAVLVSRRALTPGALETLGIPVLEGRGLADADRAEVPPVALVSQSLARQMWPERSPLGQRFRVASDGPLITVVGVVGDVRQHWLVDPVRPTYYRPYAQDAAASIAIVLKTAIEPQHLTAGLRRAVEAEDPELPVAQVQPMEGAIEDLTAGLRFAGRTLGVIALISSVLAAVGIYSLMSFLAGRRSREMGVRMALGATSGEVIRLTCVQASKLVGAGLVVGLVLAFLVGRGLEAALFGVVASSAPLVVGVALLLGLTALAASYLPARRVSRVDPTIALRAE